MPGNKKIETSKNEDSHIVSLNEIATNKDTTASWLMQIQKAYPIPKVDMSSLSVASKNVSTAVSIATKPVVDFYLSPVFSQMAKNLAETMASYKPLAEKASAIVLANTIDVGKLISPLNEMLAKIQKEYLLSVAESLKGMDLTDWLGRLQERVFQEALAARWFPLPAWDADAQLMDAFLDILDSTAGSKQKVKEIDSLIFGYYTKTKIEAVKKSWRNEISYYHYRMLHQAVQAYHRHEYALTLAMLSTMWEGIIYDKVNDSRRKKGSFTKENFSKLIGDLKFKELYETFFTEYIFYDCNSSTDVIDDVPGRHGVAHSYYQKYPSKKAALNAILFTDFLMKIKIDDAEQSQCNP